MGKFYWDDELKAFAFVGKVEESAAQFAQFVCRDMMNLRTALAAITEGELKVLSDAVLTMGDAARLMDEECVPLKTWEGLSEAAQRLKDAATDVLAIKRRYEPVEVPVQGDNGQS